MSGTKSPSCKRRSGTEHKVSLMLKASARVMSPPFCTEGQSAEMHIVFCYSCCELNCLGLTWNFRSKSSGCDASSTELFSLGAFAPIAPKKSAPMIFDF